jgi:hypothetical protein
MSVHRPAYVISLNYSLFIFLSGDFFNESCVFKCLAAPEAKLLSPQKSRWVDVKSQLPVGWVSGPGHRWLNQFIESTFLEHQSHPRHRAQCSWKSFVILSVCCVLHGGKAPSQLFTSICSSVASPWNPSLRRQMSLLSTWKKEWRVVCMWVYGAGWETVALSVSLSSHPESSWSSGGVSVAASEFF